MNRMIFRRQVAGSTPKGKTARTSRQGWPEIQGGVSMVQGICQQNTDNGYGIHAAGLHQVHQAHPQKATGLFHLAPAEKGRPWQCHAERIFNIQFANDHVSIICPLTAHVMSFNQALTHSLVVTCCRDCMPRSKRMDTQDAALRKSTAH